MKRRFAIVALAALVGALMATQDVEAPPAASASTPAANVPAALQKFYAQQLVWTPCDNKLECAQYDVPLDYAKPAGATVTIKVARAVATQTSHGALVINPGGPGGSGIEYISDPSYAISATARRNFDLVSFDPRGVGQSDPLWCFQGSKLDAFLEIDPTPDTAVELTAVIRGGKALATACKAENAALMAHMSTIEIARDMDIMRALLHEDRLRYIGKSWGSALGQAYAALFPSHVGAFVLDGVVDLRVSRVQGALDQGLGFEAAINRFISWCLVQGSCPLGTTQAKAKQRLVAFFAQLDAHPMATSNPSRPLTEAEALTAVLGPMYIQEGGRDWLLTALTPALETGRGTALQEIYDWFVERDSKGVFANNANTAIYVVNCLDEFDPGITAAQAQTLTTAWTPKMPVMASTMAWSEVPCTGWPYRAVTDTSALRIKNVPPMLVVSATYDPATPMKWGKAVASQIPGAVLLTRDGDGHTSYANGSLCIDRAVDAYLLSSDPLHPTLPKVGTRCE